LTPGLFLRQAAPLVLFHCQFKMLRNLSIQFRVPVLLLKKGQHPLQALA
jgi:hypothetical protein